MARRNRWRSLTLAFGVIALACGLLLLLTLWGREAEVLAWLQQVWFGSPEYAY
jgi:hypothetical protein